MDIDSLNAIPIGTRLTLICQGMIDTYETQGTLVGELYQHGYITPVGAWALYPREKDKPCYVIPFRKKGKRKPAGYKTDFTVVDFRIGWE